LFEDGKLGEIHKKPNIYMDNPGNIVYNEKVYYINRR
jgi:hypothetical protein